MYTRWTTVDIYIRTLMIYVLLCCCYAMELTCNNDQVVEVGSSAILECTGSPEVSFDSPTAVRVARCGFDGTCVSDVSRYDITVINRTTHLNITSVQVSDADVWRCVNLFTTGQDSTCNLEVTKTPSCHISSDRNTDALELNEEITLTVNITDYYCSRPFDFLLQTGDTTQVLEKDISLNAVQSLITSSTFNMSESHNGSLKLIFGCHNKRIPCSGVLTLIMRPLPTCIITSYSGFQGLKAGDEITLYVYIDDYSCSGYLLHTGGVLTTLNQLDGGMYKGNATIFLTSSHFGSVYVSFICNGVRRSITCAGITTLSKMNIFDQPSLMAAGIGIGIGIGIATALLIVGIRLLMKRKEICLMGGTKPSHSDTISANKEESQRRPESISQDDGIEYEMPGITYENLDGNTDAPSSYDILETYEVI